MKIHVEQKIKKTFALVLALVFAISVFTVSTSATEVADFKVELTTPSEVNGGEVFTVTATVTDIKYPQSEEAEGIFGASIFLYYDSDYLTPVLDSFSATAPSGWDKFDGTGTTGIWALYAVFDGTFSSAAKNDGDISFQVSFTVTSAEDFDVETAFYIQGCECTGYDENSMFKTSEYQSTAFCKNPLTIKAFSPLVPKDDCPFVIDEENKIIYSDKESITLGEFKDYFKLDGSEITVTAFDYEVTEENGKYIPNGAKIIVTNAVLNKKFEFTYYLLGDCNCDGKVNLTDLAIVKTVIVQRLPSEGHVKYAMEFEKDGVIRLSDYLRLKKYIATK